MTWYPTNRARGLPGLGKDALGRGLPRPDWRAGCELVENVRVALWAGITKGQRCAQGSLHFPPQAFFFTSAQFLFPTQNYSWQQEKN